MTVVGKFNNVPVQIQLDFRFQTQGWLEPVGFRFRVVHQIGHGHDFDE